MPDRVFVKAFNAWLVGFLLLHATQVLAAEDFYLDSQRNNRTLRIEMDNDVAWKSDSGFTNGWSIQYYTPCKANWEDVYTLEPIKWVGKHFPMLNDKDGIVRLGHGVGQNMVTPEDLEAEVPAEGDLPYAGSLTYTLSLQNFNRRKASTFQVSVGVLGPSAFAEQFQKFVHNDLGVATNPNGWDTQRKTEPILNLGYQYAHCLASMGEYHDGWAGQLILSPSASLGNMLTAAELLAAFRIGWNMLEGFTSYSAPPGRGFFHAAYLPKPASACPHAIEFVLGGRATALAYAVIYDGSLITSDDRDVERRYWLFSAGIGLYYHYYDYFSIRATLQRSTDLLYSEFLPQSSSGDGKTNTDVSFGSLIIDFHF